MHSGRTVARRNVRGGGARAWVARAVLCAATTAVIFVPIVFWMERADLRAARGLTFRDPPSKPSSAWRGALAVAREPDSPLLAPAVEVRKELGRGTWNLLHRAVAQFPEAPTDEDRRRMTSFFQLFSEVYPCDVCSKHFRAMLARSPPNVSSRDALAVWLCERHNEVNMRLRQPVFDCDAETLALTYGDCGCADAVGDGDAAGEGDGSGRTEPAPVDGGTYAPAPAAAAKGAAAAAALAAAQREASTLGPGARPHRAPAFPRPRVSPPPRAAYAGTPLPGVGPPPTTWPRGHM